MPGALALSYRSGCRDRSQCSAAVVSRRGPALLHWSLPNNLYKDALFPAAVEFAVEDLFPRAEIELAGGDRDYHFAAHDLAFEVGIGVILAGAVMPVRRWGHAASAFRARPRNRGQTGFIVVDEYRRGDVHRVGETK